MKCFYKFIGILVVISLLLSFVACDFDKGNSESKTKDKGYNQEELCEKIAENLAINEIEKAVELSDELDNPSKSEKKIVMDALVERLNNRVKTFLKSFATDYSLVSQETLDEVEKYKSIITNVGITSEDYTNVDDYVDAILELEKYIKYNDVWAYYQEALDDWNNGNTYWNRAIESYSDYMRETHLQKALTSYKSCVTKANDYSESSFGIKAAKGLAQMYVDKIEYWFETGYEMYVDETSLDSYSRILDTFFEDSEQMVSDLKTLPLSVYYGE